MWQALLGQLIGNQGQALQNNNTLDQRRQQYQQLLQDLMSTGGINLQPMRQSARITGGQSGNLMGLMSLLGGGGGGPQKYNPPMSGNMGAFYGNYYGR